MQTGVTEPWARMLISDYEDSLIEFSAPVLSKVKFLLTIYSLLSSLAVFVRVYTR